MRELMGIVNVTPDSFSDGGENYDAAKAMEHAEQLFLDGATYVDIGGESTRPGATPVDSDEEWRRVETVLGELIPRFPGRISFDTYHPENVRRATGFGAFIINDVTGMTNPLMLSAVGAARQQTAIKVIASHLPKNYAIQTAHKVKPIAELKEIVLDLRSIAQDLEMHGFKKEDIILDPGIGFGKTPDANWLALEIGIYIPEYTTLIGYSRKRFLGDDRMSIEKNIAAARIALQAGAQILRVHDVAGHVEIIDEFNAADLAAS